MSAPRRLLVISYHFGPEGPVGGLRWHGMTKYLARHGWTSAVLTASEHVPDTGLGVQIESCRRFATSFETARGLRRWLLKRSSTGSESRAGGSREPRGFLRQIGRELTAMLAFPDYSRGWILRAAMRARALVRRFRPHAVVSSGPPHSAHIVAGLAADRSVPWIVDLRDPWSGPFPAIWRSDRVLGSHTYRLLSEYLERIAVGKAAAVLTTTPQLADALRPRYPGARILCVPNGVDLESLPVPAGDPYPGLSIAYAGTLYGGRDISPVLRALAVFFERHPEAVPAGSKLRIAGEADPRHARTFYELVAAARIGQAVEILGLLPRRQALETLARSRMALVLAQQQELQIPAKLYEAVAIGVPTLVLAPEGSATALEGRRLGAIVHEPEDVAGIAGVLERVWRDGVRERLRCPPTITYGALAEVVDDLLHGPGSAA